MTMVIGKLFIQSSKISVRGFLKHYGNIKPPIPLTHAVNTKETYEAMKTC